MTIGRAVWHINGVEIEKLHLVAGEGKALTNDGISIWNCVDVDNADGWYEIDLPDAENDAE